MYKLLKTQGKARRGEFHTVHGTVQTPAFMNVATAGAIKGGLSAFDLKDNHCQVMLCNTYHLHLRPGDTTVRKLGGLHRFTRWDGPILTDSGGFQVFSLSGLRKISEEGVTFASHLDGRRIFMGPEQSMQIQANLGSTIAMAFDECVANPAEYAYAKQSCERTVRWLVRCKTELARLKNEGEAVNPQQMLFGINQGCCFDDLRVQHMQRIAELDLDGYAIGGLAVGEPKEEMYRVISAVEEHMPKEKIRYLMGVGTPGQYPRGGAQGRRPVRLRDAQPQCAPRPPVHMERHHQHQKRQVRAGRGPAGRLVRLRVLPEFFARLSAPSVQGGRNAGHAPCGDTQPAFLQHAFAAHPRRAGRRQLRCVLPPVRRPAGHPHLRKLCFFAACTCNHTLFSV